MLDKVLGGGWKTLTAKEKPEESEGWMAKKEMKIDIGCFVFRYSKISFGCLILEELFCSCCVVEKICLYIRALFSDFSRALIISVICQTHACGVQTRQITEKLAQLKSTKALHDI